jgi:aspartate/methionine/tyrosine aminotransferase
VDISPRSCVPTTGSVAGSFGSFIACTQRIPGKDKVLFIDPGFPIQKSQLRVLGIGWYEFDIHPYRGAERLEPKLEEMLAAGDIAAIIYSNPNNPAWICLEEEELEVIGRLATKHDVIVMEDLAYFCMDYRKDLGHPFEPPFVPTVARYTDNYIILLSGSKIFSYAGQRATFVAIDPVLAKRVYPALEKRLHNNGELLQSFAYFFLYALSSGVCHSVQYGMAAMLQAACEGKLRFVDNTREYARRAKRIKEILVRNGFHIVYDKDANGQEVGDGFFFTFGYKDWSGKKLVNKLIYYGVSAISLESTGAQREGMRGCASTIREDQYEVLDERLRKFNEDYSLYDPYDPTQLPEIR